MKKEPPGRRDGSRAGSTWRESRDKAAVPGTALPEAPTPGGGTPPGGPPAAARAAEVVDGNGEILAVSSLDELSIDSMELSLRKATDRPATGTPQADRPAGTASAGGYQPGTAADPEQSPGAKDQGPGTGDTSSMYPTAA